MAGDAVRLRIGLHIASLEASGISRFAVNLADGLRSRGHQVIIISDQHAHHPIVAEQVAILGGGSAAARVGRLRRLAETLRLAAIVSNGYFADVLNVAAFPFDAGPKLVSVSHSRPALWATDRAQGLKRTAAQLAVTIAHRRAAELVAVSRGLARELEERKWAARPYRVIYNPVVTPFVLSHRRKRPIELNEFRIVCIGWISPNKGQHLILEAASKLKERLPKCHIAVDVVGDVARGHDSYRWALDDFATCHQQTVRFTGPLANPYPVLVEADVCVLASRSEALPTVLIEAMALGVPVISADCPHGPAEILGDGHYGLLFPVGDSATLSEQLFHLACAPQERERLARRGQVRARDFDQARAAEQYELLLRNILQASHR